MDHKILGWVDEITVCDCCGKSDLSGTYAVETAEGDVLHYGSTCAKRNTGIKNPDAAAKAYRVEREKAATTKLRQTAEYRAKEAKVALREVEFKHKRLLPGPKARAFVEPEWSAYEAVRRAISTEFNVNVW